LTGNEKEKRVTMEERRPVGSPAVVTVGTFDGVHVGHRVVLERLKERGRILEMNSLVVTFDPHPLSVLRPAEAPSLLTTTEEKLRRILQIGVDRVEVIPFTYDFAALSPREFVRDILREDLAMEELVIGYNHGFGRDREGSVHMLKSLAAEMGFRLSVVEPVLVNGEKVSSSRIRRCIDRADFDFANRALGRPYSFSARVVPGEGRGKALGFPTANLEVVGADKLIPPPGVYAVRGWIKEESFVGMMHQGERPTFPGSPPSMEVHLIGFEGDVSNERLVIDYLSRMRDIRRFDGPDELREQLGRDRKRSMEIFAKVGTLQSGINGVM
jgi:riboflavin kinase/FMN adenylyltransferase